MSKFSEKEIRQKAIEYMEIYGMSRHEERVATKLKTSLKDVGVSYERDNPVSYTHLTLPTKA